jgi:hypothetical protein
LDLLSKVVLESRGGPDKAFALLRLAKHVVASLLTLPAGPPPSVIPPMPVERLTIGVLMLDPSFVPVAFFGAMPKLAHLTIGVFLAVPGCDDMSPALGALQDCVAAMPASLRTMEVGWPRRTNAPTDMPACEALEAACTARGIAFAWTGDRGDDA